MLTEFFFESFRGFRLCVPNLLEGSSKRSRKRWHAAGTRRSPPGDTPRNACMPPEVIQAHVSLPGCTVISYSCEGGREAMARAFLAGNLAAYIGCRTEPDVVAMNVFLMHFLFGVLAKRLSDRDAWHRAVAATDHEDIYTFSYYHSDGTEERF